MRILLYRSGALGDTLLTLPALDTLRRLHPLASLTLAARPAYGAPLLGAGRIDTLIDAGAPPFHLLHAAPALHAEPEGQRPTHEDDDLDRLLRAFGLIILLTRDPEGAAAARLKAHRPEAPGVKTRRVSSLEAEPLIVPPFPPEGDRRHIASWTLAGLAPLGGDISTLPGTAPAPAGKCREMRALSCTGVPGYQPAPEAVSSPERVPGPDPEANLEAAVSNLDPNLLPTPDPLIQTKQIQSDADQTLNHLGISTNPFIAIHPGGGGRSKWPPPSTLASLARGFCTKTGARPLLIEGPADAVPTAAFKASWGELETAWGGDEIPILSSPPLDLLSALLTRSAAYIGGDSGVSHLAALSGAPTLALFGPDSDPDRWAPIGPNAGWLSWDRMGDGVGVLMGLANTEP